MILTIIELDQCTAALQPRFGRYPPLFPLMFQTTSASFSYRHTYLLDGEPLPDLVDLEGIIISGSGTHVYDSHPWMDPLFDFTRKAYDRDIPLLGVCFGHQVMAEALGGKVEKSEKGRGIGRHVYKFSSKLDCFKDIPDSVAIAASHFDQVIEPPAGSEVFLSSKFTPNAGLIYQNGTAISLQPHPEITVDYARAILEQRRGNQISVPDADSAINSYARPLDRLVVAQGLANFLIGKYRQ